MKKFALFTIGFTPPTPEDMQAWMQWFGSLQERMVDQVGLMNGKEVSAVGTTDLAMDENTITGYLVIEAESMDEALEIAAAGPKVTSTRVYEVRSH